MPTDLDTPVPFTKHHSFLLSNHDRKLDDHGRKLDDHSRKLDVNSEELHRLGILMEENIKDTKLILDIVLNTQNRLARFEHLDERVTSHDHRIAALEAFTPSDSK
jgi:hypothetical protein